MSAAALAAMMQAIKASGAIVQIEPRTFESIVRKTKEPLVLHATAGMFSKHNQYLTSYKGLTFYAKSPETLYFSSSVEVMETRKIWIPG